ncbi:ParB/RepB/Spo0J family partition protein [Paraburkholderia sp. BR10872]|uniref:ParB/RepB/Spo0J family partition protein n=1 Tax=Paraburkholderia sp. BR10872 TaxID=3236989 RepID=UPI0034D28E06
MSIKDRMAAKTAAIAPLGKNPRAPSVSDLPKTGPGQFLAAMPLLAEKDEQLEKMSAENRELREQVAKGSPGGFEVALDKLVEVKGRRRFKSAEKYAELRENLRNNALIEPIVVAPLADGQYEILAGHHRTDAYRELGRPTIRAITQEGSEDEAEDGAFYSNLLQSDLTDYEKYRGFKAKQDRNPKLTQAQLAKLSGFSESTISFLFAFEHLPPDVISMLHARPDLLGATAGYALANLAKQGRDQQVVAAVKKLAAGEVDQSQAVKLASGGDAREKPAAAAAVSDKIKIGKAVYCQMRRANNVLRLQFQSDAEAERVHAAIRAVLESEAKAGQSDKND